MRFKCFLSTAYVVKFDSTVAKTGTTQIIRRGHIHLKNNQNNSKQANAASLRQTKIIIRYIHIRYTHFLAEF